MAKRTIMALIISAFLIIGQINAMNSQEMSPSEKENVYKMWMFQQGLKDQEKKGKLPAVPKDVGRVIGSKLHDLSQENPVLEGTIGYIDTQLLQIVSFKIRDLVKDGILDIPNKIFKNPTIEPSTIITIDPEVFFANHGERIIVLIAPWSLIHNTLNSSSAPLKPMMPDWDPTKSPIGIFWRYGTWESKYYIYLTNAYTSQFSSRSLYEWFMSYTRESKKEMPNAYVRGTKKWTRDEMDAMEMSWSYSNLRINFDDLK